MSLLKRIFIGSSLEAEDVATAIKQKLYGEFECWLWNDGFFTLGNNFFSDLVQKIISFDYAIMVGAADDCVKRLSNHVEKIAPRDNIYLEYGLFSGIIAPKRVLLLLQEKCTPASDLSGISLMKYFGIKDAAQKTYDWIKNLSNSSAQAISKKDIELLPTVGVAGGYYDNFVYRFVSKLGEQISSDDFILNIYVPTFLTNNVYDYKKRFKESFKVVRG